LNFTLMTVLGWIDFLGEVAGLGGYEEVKKNSEVHGLYSKMDCLVLSLEGLPGRDCVWRLFCADKSFEGQNQTIHFEYSHDFRKFFFTSSYPPRPATSPRKNRFSPIRHQREINPV